MSRRIFGRIDWRRFARRWPIALLAIPILLVALLPLRTRGEITAVHLLPGIVGQAFPSGAYHLTFDVPVTNRGTAPASSVVVTSVSAAGQDPVGPVGLPVYLGSIAVGDAADLPLDFDRNYFPTGTTGILTVGGTYEEDGLTRGFELSIPYTVLNPGTPDSTTEESEFSTSPDPPGPDRGPNGFYPHDPATNVTPSENEEPPTLTGPSSVAPNDPESDINVNVDAGGFPAVTTLFQPDAITDPLRFGTHQNYNADIPGTGPNSRYGVKSPYVLDPTVARSTGDEVLVSGNLYLGVSLNGGAAFTALDPTMVFEKYPGGRNLESDQVVHYAPTVDRFAYVAISVPPGVVNATNDLRVAIASPAGIRADLTAVPRKNTAWTTYTLDPAAIGLPNMWIDFPDISISAAGWLSMSGQIFQKVAGPELPDQYRGYYVISALLTDLQNPPGGHVTWWELFFNNSNVDGTQGRFTQDANTFQHLAAHIDSSTLRVGTRNPATKVWTLRNVEHAMYNKAHAAFTVAGGGDQWLSSGGFDRVLGATERLPAAPAHPELWFGWNAGRDANYPRPYIRIAVIDQNTWTLIENRAIWNPNFAWAFPSFSSNSNAEVGMAAMVGPENGIPNFGITMLTGTYANGTDVGSAATKPRWGDYMTIRRDPKNPKLFSATGYGIAANPNTYRLWYVRFGRRADVIAGP